MTQIVVSKVYRLAASLLCHFFNTVEEICMGKADVRNSSCNAR